MIINIDVKKIVFPEVIPKIIFLKIKKKIK